MMNDQNCHRQQREARWISDQCLSDPRWQPSLLLMVRTQHYCSIVSYCLHY